MKNLSILVVDDDQHIRKLLKRRLMRDFSSVDEASNGYLAREMLNQTSYDVVLTDLIMPGEFGGLDVLEAAKEINSRTEVVLITGHSSIETAVEAMKKGANDYLEKPINFDELFLRLDKIANMQSILRTAEDLRLAMNTTESAASVTIQNLEMEAHRLQKVLENVEQILRHDNQPPATSIKMALDIISKAQE